MQLVHGIYNFLLSVYDLFFWALDFFKLHLENF